MLGDPTRLRILHALTGVQELSVGAIAEAAGTSDDVNLPRICDWMCESLRAHAARIAGRACVRGAR